VLNVRSVLGGDVGYEVTCIVELEDADLGAVNTAQLEALGFQEGPYP
jgi:hypothetical protein